MGTGSGAIAITLKKECPMWQLIATDISQCALAVAQENAQRFMCDIDFLLGDTWEAVRNHCDLDFLISNPPYIAESERAVMDQSVLDFEPHTALFASNQGLAVYEKIAKKLDHYLKPQGHAFFEIGWQQGDAVFQLFHQYLPQRSISVIPDLSGNDRIVWIQPEKGGT